MPWWQKILQYAPQIISIIETIIQIVTGHPQGEAEGLKAVKAHLDTLKDCPCPDPK